MGGKTIRYFDDASAAGDVFYNGGVPYDSQGRLLVDANIVDVAGTLYIKPLTYLVCATTVSGSQTHLHFDDVIVDDLGVYNETTHLIEIPTDIVKIDVEYGCELASVASGFGSSANTIRAMTMNNNNGGSLVGLSALPCSRVGMDGGAYSRQAMNVYTPVSLEGNDRIIKPRFIQDSGGDIRIGDSTGTGVSQTYIKMRLYRAL